MANELAKMMKNKRDAEQRLQGQTQKPVVIENTDGSYYAPEQADYTASLAAGKNISIITSGNIKTIAAIMNLIAGSNISVSAPDANGAVTISGTIGGKAIDLKGLADGYVLTYDLPSDKFIMSEVAASIPQATETVLGGIKAKAKTTESSEVAIDGATGKLYAPAPDAATNGLPQGGIAGQVLSKIDGTDYNSQWIDAPSGINSELIALPSYLTGTISSSAYAWKGNMFKPDIDHKLYALGYIGNIVAGATYQACVLTKTSGDLIDTIIKTPKKTLPSVLSATSTKCLWLKFDEPIVLTAGISYYLLIGRTDSTDTFVLPLPFSGGTSDANAVPMMGLSHGNAALIAKANPVVGDPISLITTNSAAQYFLFEQP